MCVCKCVCVCVCVRVCVCVCVCVRGHIWHCSMFTCTHMAHTQLVCMVFVVSVECSMNCVVGERGRETLSGVTQLKIGDSLYMCVDVRLSFCTLTLAFLCLLRGLPLPIPPLNRISRLAIPYHSRRLIVYPFVLGCF